MRITHFAVKNWRNFKSADIRVVRRLFIVGPNASGKSNLLDALRFLGEIAADGGGLQQAVRTRGGVGHVRCLAARNFNRGRVELKLRIEGPDALVWDYRLEFSSESRGRHRPLITAEEVSRNGERLLTRPIADDKSDPELLTQTALEQVTANRNFREIARFLQAIRYVHLVPQLIREPDLAGESDESPYGREFLARIAGTPEKSRTRRLAVVNRALNSAVPQLEELEFIRDDAGRPHLQARYRHWRQRGAIQDERDFSDGTLRLMSLLWLLTGRSSAKNRVLLLEEPELSLHAAVCSELPSLFARALRSGGPQVIVTTHSDELLADPGLGLDEVVLLEPSDEGTTTRSAADVDAVQDLLDAEMNLSEILGPLTRPSDVGSLSRLAR